MAEQRETVVLEFEVDEDESIESINKLTKANKELRAERNALNLQSEAGKKRAQEINSLLDQNTNKIKTNVSAIEKQKINIGNYKSALDGVHPVLGKVGEGLEKGTSGFLGMAKAALAFIATPIGAILAALVAVFSLLKTALSQNDELMDKFENITSAVGVAVEVLVSRVGKLGEALIELAQGNFSAAIDKTAEAFTGLAAEIGAAVKQQQIFLDASRKLVDDTRLLNIQIARTENELKRLDKASKNVNLTFDEQRDLVLKAAALQERLVRQKEDLARRDLVNTARQLRSEKEFQQTAEENFDQYVKRLLDSSKLGDAEKDKIAAKIIALENARGASLDDQAKRENQLAAIEEKRTAALNKQTAALDKNTDAERNARIAKLEREQQGKRGDPLADAFPTQVKLETDLTKLMKDQLEERAKNTDAYYKDKNEKAAEAAFIEEQVERQKVAIIGQLTGSLANLAQQDSEAHQVLASAQALINTYLAATAALASGSEINPVFGILSAAAAIANGLAAVARINGIQFAEGGWTGPGPKMKAVGVVHADEYVTPKRVVHMAQAQPHLAALERLRGGYADGGFAVDNLTNPINQQLAISNLLKNMPPQEVSVVEIARVDRRVKVKETMSKR